MPPISYDKLVLFGDSITQMCCGARLDFNFGGVLQNDYVRFLDVLNRGYGGYNTAWGKYILPEILKAEMSEFSEIKLMTIFLGTNDARETNQKVELDVYKANLTEMVQIVVDLGIKVVLIGPGVYDPALAKESGICSNRTMLNYCNTAEKVAKQFNVPFIHLWNSFREASSYTEEQLLSDTCDLSKFLMDGIHYTGSGYRILYEKLTEAIKENYEELVPSNMPMRLANYDKIDPHDIKDSIFKNESK